MRGQSRLTARINLVLGIIVVLVAVNAVLAVGAARERNRARTTSTALRGTGAAVSELAQASIDQETQQRGYLITGDAQEYLPAYRAASARAASAQRDLARSTASDPGLRRTLVKVNAALAAWQHHADGVEIAARDQGAAAAAAAVATGRGKALFDDLRSQTAALADKVTAQVDAARARSQRAYDRFVALVFVTLGAVLVMAVGQAVLLARWITRPVEQLARSVEEVGAGNPDHELVVSGPSELIKIGTAVENMRTRLAQEIARAEASARELAVANAELEAFSYSVSHDLRAPLRSIDGFSQAVLEDAGDELDEVSRGHFARIRAATQRMAELIDDLLKLSRVSRITPVPVEVDVTATALHVIDDLCAANADRAVDVTVQPGLRALADPSLVQAVLENLLGNAWKFTVEQAQPKVWVAGTGSSPHTVFTVSDNGAGFDQAYADKLFKPFQRLHTDREFPGTGIGLATVARIVHRHGGEVAATGTIGHGATITFTLSGDTTMKPAQESN
ncbi:MAG: Sensory box histidine kinase [Acidimicrobiales bacterium]|nr:Sensory box histidine kinase [Acidimicrobiales bacterium]